MSVQGADFGVKHKRSEERETPPWLVESKRGWAEHRAQQRQAKKDGTYVSYAQQDAENDRADALVWAEHNKKLAEARLLKKQKKEKEIQEEEADAARSLLVNEQARRLLETCLEGEQIPKDVPKSVYARFLALRQRQRLGGHDLPVTCYAARELPREDAGPAPLPNDGVRRCEHVLGRKYCGSIYCALMEDGTPRCERHDEKLQRERAVVRAAQKRTKQENLARHAEEARRRIEWRLNNPGLPYPEQGEGDQGEEDEEDEEDSDYVDGWEEGAGEGAHESDSDAGDFRMVYASEDDETEKAFEEMRRDVLPTYYPRR